MRRRAYLAGFAGSSLAAVAGCTAIGDLGDRFLGSEYDIGMSRNEFDPDDYTVAVGDTVVWKNTSEATHTVTAFEASIPDEADYFASGGYDDEATAREAWWDDFGGGFDTRETYAHTFEVPGNYSYFCVPHETDGRDGARMMGVVRVTE